MNFYDRLKNGLVLFDGAMGTQIHELNPTAEEWDGKIGCPEVLNLTAPDKVQQIHAAYLEAGADVIETNTFGGNAIVLSEYGLQDQVIEINRVAAQIARRAVDNHTAEKRRFVAGSIGPGTKLITLGQTDFDSMYHSYALQMQGLIEGGADLLVIETCQDLLQAKIALLAALDAMEKHKIDLPLIVSVTVETSGTLLIGSEIGAVIAALAPYNIAALGMNCATGPEHMRPYIRQICQQFSGPVLCQPNAGLPKNVGGEMKYTISISEFADALMEFVIEEGVQIIGGCCGTTPEFTKALADRLLKSTQAEQHPESQPAVASLFSAQTLRQDPGPFFVGERANTNGSKEFREYLLKNDWDGVVSVARQQQNTGAHGLDLCVAYTGRDEAADMKEAIRRIVTQVNLPLFIDSTDVRVIEEALRLCGGHAVINSINLEDGENRADQICRLAKRYGASLIALTIDEQGMAREVEKKVAVAKRIYDIAVNRHQLKPYDLIFDALTFTLGSGDETLKDAGINTLEGIRAIKTALPGVFAILGVSNVSFGLAPHSREILNSVFLAEAVKAGLDMAIVNVKKIMPLYQIADEDLGMCLNLIYNRGGANPLFDFIGHFDKKAGLKKQPVEHRESLSLDDRIKRHVIDGDRSGFEQILLSSLEKKSAIEIINDLLIPAMKTVGDLFGSGQMQLPFVLQSAEVMKFAVDKLQPFMEKSEAQTQTSIVLATVRGDVHDIGKNLVEIILSNNGYKVYNLGIKCELETMLQKALEVKADAIGMSGLLVKSTVVMKENLQEMQHRGVNIPVLLGGAALTRSYVDEVCAPILETPVAYCSDAFEGLKTMELIKEKQLVKNQHQTAQSHKKAIQARDPQVKEEAITYEEKIPVPPFWGDKIVRDLDLDTIFSFLTESVLFRGRWGYRRGKLTKVQYDALIENEVRPQFEQLKRRCKDELLFQPALVYGYYPCNSEKDQVIVYRPERDEELIRFNFPREGKVPHRCIADYFLPLNSGQRDLIALQVVTIGEKASEEAKKLFQSDEYKNYLLFHGLGVESAEALAEYWHKRIREELGIANADGSSIDELVVQKYRGSRFSFGYPACPDLAENRKIFALLQPERIGITLTEGDQMIPEQTTSAFIVHHPQAKYFNIE
jgi:5-methyltetrahydrofolate--homocysteine methyltransferase